MKIKLATFTCLLCILLLSCNRDEKKTVMGYAPIYSDTIGYKLITLQPATSIQDGGKIYIFNRTLYQVETNKGIHIIDISNPSKPVNKNFIAILGCQEVSAKNDTIFTNNFNDLVAISIQNNQLKELKRLSNHFSYPLASSIPPARGYFICPKQIPGKIITGWEQKTLTNPECFW